MLPLAYLSVTLCNAGEYLPYSVWINYDIFAAEVKRVTYIVKYTYITPYKMTPVMASNSKNMSLLFNHQTTHTCCTNRRWLNAEYQRTQLRQIRHV